MCQCPMTSSWFTAFYDGCLKSRPAMQKLVRFSQHYVGGTEGGPVNGSTWNSSFHGYDEVMGDRYQLCARDLDPRPPHTKWLEFEACQNGLGGVVGIVDIPRNSKKCAWQAGLGWEALRACAEGERGLELYHSSVLFTAANCAQPPFVCYDFPKSVVDPDGQGHGLPVIKIGGRMHYGLDAYTNLTQRICAVIAGTGAECGCDCRGVADAKTGYSAQSGRRQVVGGTCVRSPLPFRCTSKLPSPTAARQWRCATAQ
jgi:hypothetical protein